MSSRRYLLTSTADLAFVHFAKSKSRTEVVVDHNVRCWTVVPPGVDLVSLPSNDRCTTDVTK